jgi:hypothetical protein
MSSIKAARKGEVNVKIGNQTDISAIKVGEGCKKGELQKYV